MDDPTGAPRVSTRQEKLLFLVVVLYLLAGLWGLASGGGPTGAGRLLVLLLFALFVPLHLLLRGWRPPEPVVWTVLSAGVLLVGWRVIDGRARGDLPAGDAGLVGLLAALLVLIVPASHHIRAVRHGSSPLRRTGLSGLVLVAGLLVPALALARPPFERVGPTAFYLLLTSLLYGLARHQEREHLATPVRRKQRLCVTIIAMNEADRIGRCLDSVRDWADEIVVLDSGSTDDTVAIAGRYTDRVFVTDWPGYGPQKQRALEKATGDWVLSIDADEELTPELRHDIDEALGDQPECVAYKLPWGVIVYGKLLDFGRSSRAPLRLFLREGARFTDDLVHETIVPAPGRVGRLRGRLLHYTQRDYGHALRKNAEYGWLGAQRRFARGKRSGGMTGACLRALLVFVQVYIIRLGFLDGQQGFLMASLYAQVGFNKYAGLWTLELERRRATKEEPVRREAGGVSRG